jgi:hypothetical protein
MPVICEGILSMKQMPLTPAHFMRTFGDEEVDLIDCESGEVQGGSLKDILRLYDAPREHDRALKVKVRSSLPCVIEMDPVIAGIIRTGRLKTLSEVENLPKYTTSLKTAYRFPI